jgi:hypothetical protein
VTVTALCASDAEGVLLTAACYRCYSFRRTSIHDSPNYPREHTEPPPQKKRVIVYFLPLQVFKVDFRPLRRWLSSRRHTTLSGRVCKPKSLGQGLQLADLFDYLTGRTKRGPRIYSAQ